MTSEFPPQPGGIGNHAYHLGLYLSKNKYTVTVIADQRDIDNTEELDFDAALPFAVQRIPLRKQRWLMYFHRIAKTLPYFKQSHYVIATGKFSLWNVALYSLFYKRSTLAIIHGSEVNLKVSVLQKATNWSLKRFDIIVAVSNYTKQLVRHLKRDVQVIPNGIDLNSWQSNTITKANLSGAPVLTTIGRVSSRKGQLQVIKLLPELVRDYPSLHYHCVGIPTEASAFLAQAEVLGVDAHVTFHGALDAADLRAVLLASDVFVMLSTESPTGDVEGFGIAILEANAMGIPAIGSKGCGIEDAIRPGETGFLVDLKDGIAITHAINTISSKRSTFSRNAKDWAALHDWSQIIKRYIDLMP